MKPTIHNAFNDRGKPLGGGLSGSWDPRQPGQPRDPMQRCIGGNASGATPRAKGPDAQSSLSPLQADLRESDFGWSLELCPIQAIDAVVALTEPRPEQPEFSFLVSMEQCGWSDGKDEVPLTLIAKRLALPVVEQFDSQLVLERASLIQLVSLCRPTRLLIVAVEGMVDSRDARAMNKAIESGVSPLLAEVRAVAAMEVLGDRSVVLHCRTKSQALHLVAENFRHYLSALRNRPVSQFSAPEIWQLERLFDVSGSMTVRPIETQVFSTSIDIGINTSAERFNQPANRSLIYDVFSDSWHDEP